MKANNFEDNFFVTFLGLYLHETLVVYLNFSVCAYFKLFSASSFKTDRKAETESCNTKHVRRYTITSGKNLFYLAFFLN